MGVILCTHPICGDSHMQCNANREVATTSPPFYNRTDYTFFLRRLHLEQSSHPGHSTILLRSESPNCKCSKLHTVAATKQQWKSPDEITLLLFVHPYIYGYCSSRTSRSWWIAHSPQRQRRVCNSTIKQSFYILSFSLKYSLPFICCFCKFLCHHVCPARPVFDWMVWLIIDHYLYI